MAKKKTVVINYFGGPGAGKSTCALEATALLKKQGFDAEYVQEYATELVRDNNMELLDGNLENQKILLQEQQKRIDKLIKGGVDYALTDSSILLNPMYLKEPNAAHTKQVLDQFQKADNINLFIERGDTFQTEDRIHNLEESKQLDEKIRGFLKENNIDFMPVNHNNHAKLLNALLEHRQSRSIEKGQVIYASLPTNQDNITKQLLYVKEVTGNSIEALPILSVANTSIREQKNVTFLSANRENSLPIDSLLRVDTLYKLPLTTEFNNISINFTEEEIKQIDEAFSFFERDEKIIIKDSIEEQRITTESTLKKFSHSIQSNPLALSDYLKFAASFSSLDETTRQMVFLQNPDATKLGTAEAWEKIHNTRIDPDKADKAILLPISIETQYIDREEEKIPLETGTEAEIEKALNDEIPIYKEVINTYQAFYDITQTTLPQNSYDKYYAPSYEKAFGEGATEKIHETICDFALVCAGIEKISVEAVNNSTIHAYYNSSKNEIILNNSSSAEDRLNGLIDHTAKKFIEKGTSLSGKPLELAAKCLSYELHQKLGIDFPEQVENQIVRDFAKISNDRGPEVIPQILKTTSKALQYAQNIHFDLFDKQAAEAIQQNQQKEKSQGPVITGENLGFLVGLQER